MEITYVMEFGPEETHPGGKHILLAAVSTNAPQASEWALQKYRMATRTDSASISRRQVTGRYPIRSGLTRVLFPNDKIGMPDAEITIAQALKKQGYATACIGKWHLGHLPPFMPTRHGFDRFYGIPYSNDMTATARGSRPCAAAGGS